MSIKAIVRELREIRDGVGDKSRPGSDGRYWHCRMRSPIAPDQAPLSLSVEQCQWANLPQELLLDIIRRVEASETSWPARAVVIFCASVCRSWREVTKGIVKALEECGRLTFPISLKQPGPRACPIQCFIRRDRTTSRYFLYYGLVPSEYDRDKLLLAARKIRRATSKDFVISLATDDFSRASNTYVGKIRSNFLGTKFTIYDSQPPCDAAATQPISRSSRRFHSKQVSPRVPACNYSTGTVSYELNVLRTRGPRRMHCVMNSIPFSSIREGGTAPTPTSSLDQPSPLPLTTKGNEPSKELIGKTKEPLVLKNKSPRWHEQLQCWCLNFRGRVTVASVKNFQLVADCDPSQNVPVSEQEKVILQFGKIGKDIFTMDYRYPLSAFQAFAIALSSFDTKPACE